MSQLPEGPKSSPWWQMLRWITDPLAFQDDCVATYGDTFTLQLGGLGTIVIIGNPQAIQEIFSQDVRQFDVGRANKIVEPLFGSNSLFVLDGDRHKRERKLLMPPFHGERLHTYAQLICQITEEVARHWQVGKPFIARGAMQDITLEVILQVVFGLREGESYQRIKPLLAAWLNMTDSPMRSSILFFKFLQQDWGAWSPWGRMQRRQKEIYGLLQAEIDDRRAKPELMGKDILSLMMAARDEQGNPMTDAELKDEMITLLFAGHETTATTLAWAFYQIHCHADVREKLRQEIDALGENPAPMAIAQLPYLTAVCSEVLRMYPVIPIIFPRITKVPMTIGGYDYDIEFALAPSIYLVHYREDIYPNPHQFNPERFLDRQYTPFEYLPFGGGNRRCLGYALAQLEMKLVIATVLRNQELTLATDQPVKPQRRGFTISPAGGVPLVKIGNRLPQSQPSQKVVNPIK